MLGASQSKLPVQTCSLLLNNVGFNTVLWRKGKMFNSTRHRGQHLKTFLPLASKFEFETNKNHLCLVVLALKEKLCLKLADPKPQIPDLQDCVLDKKGGICEN